MYRKRNFLRQVGYSHYIRDICCLRINLNIFGSTALTICETRSHYIRRYSHYLRDTTT